MFDKGIWPYVLVCVLIQMRLNLISKQFYKFSLHKYNYCQLFCPGILHCSLKILSREASRKGSKLSGHEQPVHIMYYTAVALSILSTIIYILLLFRSFWLCPTAELSLWMWILNKKTGTKIWNSLNLATLRLETPDCIRPLIGHVKASEETFDGYKLTWPIRGLMKSGISRRNAAKWVA